MEYIEIKNSVNNKDFKKFLLDLNKQTQSTFNYFGVISLNTIDEILQKELSRKDKLRYFVFLENELIAYSFLSLFEKSTKKHNCILGIVIGDKWQNKGYGKKICEKMIEDSWKKGLEKIWLTVHHKNKKAIKLYKLLGFEVEGIFINDEIFEEKYQTIISMALFKNNIGMGQRLKIWKEIEENIF
jgi:RimJ/RimL family protein N-acetyltransferase